MAALAGIVIVSAKLTARTADTEKATALIRVKSPRRRSCSLAQTVAFSHWPSILPFAIFSSETHCLSMAYRPPKPGFHSGYFHFDALDAVRLR